MKTRYNWDEFPECANYASTDANGDLFVWSVKPRLSYNGWRLSLSDELEQFLYIKKCDADENWRNSLEQRPQNQNTCE